jgi:hypothetical protein
MNHTLKAKPTAGSQQADAYILDQYQKGVKLQNIMLGLYDEKLTTYHLHTSLISLVAQANGATPRRKVREVITHAPGKLTDTSPKRGRALTTDETFDDEFVNEVVKPKAPTEMDPTLLMVGDILKSGLSQQQKRRVVEALLKTN